jgi:hypothetical protein
MQRLRCKATKRLVAVGVAVLAVLAGGPAEAQKPAGVQPAVVVDESAAAVQALPPVPVSPATYQALPPVPLYTMPAQVESYSKEPPVVYQRAYDEPAVMEDLRYRRKVLRGKFSRRGKRWCR